MENHRETRDEGEYSFDGNESFGEVHMRRTLEQIEKEKDEVKAGEENKDYVEGFRGTFAAEAEPGHKNHQGSTTKVQKEWKVDRHDIRKH